MTTITRLLDLSSCRDTESESSNMLDLSGKSKKAEEKHLPFQDAIISLTVMNEMYILVQ